MHTTRMPVPLLPWFVSASALIAVLGQPASAQEVAADENVRPVSGLGSGFGAMLDRVHFDRPGDGALWARGATYKARFDGSGATYVPFLGSEAPRSFPVRFALEEVLLGGQRLQLATEVEPELEGNRVSFDRGSLVELYDLETGSMEQLFWFEDLPNAGELVLRIGIESELRGAALLDGNGAFEFGNECGAVRYGEATLVDGRGRRAALETRLVEGAIEIRLSAELVQRSRLPLLVDPVISTFAVADSLTSSIGGDVAAHPRSGGACYVWQEVFSGTDNDVVSMMVDARGAAVPGSLFFVDVTTQPWEWPRIAYAHGTDRFMIVAEAVSAGVPGVSARYRSASGLTTGQIRIDSLGEEPDVGGDTFERFCVVEVDSGNVWSRLYSYTGEALAGWTLLSDPSSSNSRPAISNSSGFGSASNLGWTVAWRRTASSQSGIWGSQLWRSGGVRLPAFPMATATDRVYDNPTVSTLLDSAAPIIEYLGAWQSRPVAGGDWEIEYQVFRGNGKVGPTYRASTAYDDTSPSADSDGSSFVLAWTAAQGIGALDPRRIQARILEYRGGLPVTSLVYDVATSPINTGVHVTSDRGAAGSPHSFWFAWVKRGYYSLWGDLMGARFLTDGFGGVYCPGRPNSVGPGATIQGLGSRSLHRRDFRLRSAGCPPHQPGLFFFGPSQIDLPFGEGRRCVGGSLVRIAPPTYVDGGGVAERLLDPGASYWSALFAGSPALNFQFWYRDPGVDSDHDGTPEGFNYSAAIQIELLP